MTEIVGSGIPCPRCRGDMTRVMDSRRRNGTIYRRRVCMACRQRFATHEHEIGAVALMTPPSLATAVKAALAQTVEIEAELRRVLSYLEMITGGKA